MNVREIPVLALAIACAACVTNPRIAGGDGSAIGVAVQVVAARTLEEQDLAVIRWIEGNVPGGRLNRADSRYLLSNRVLYAARVDMPGGNQRIVYFDVTEMPGR